MPEQIDTKKILKDAESNLTRMLNFRRPLDARRLQWYKQYVGRSDPKYFPDNVTKRANTFVPYPLSNVETIVSRTQDTFFGFDPWFECAGRTEMDDAVAEKMQLVLHHKLRQAKVVPAIEELVRNIGIYGHAGIKIDWDWDYDVVVYPEAVIAQAPVVGPDGQPVIDPNTGQPAMQPMVDPMTGQPIVLGYRKSQKAVPRMRPKFIPIDVYDLLVDPDGSYIAHMTEKTLGQMKRENEVYKQANPELETELYFSDGLVELESKLGKEENADQIVVRIAEIWDSVDGTVTIMAYGKDPEALYWKDTRASFRVMANRPYRRKAYGGAPVLLWHGLNPFAHKRIPIVHTSYIKIPGEPFGMGAIEIISDLTDSLNTFVNMITDNWNLGINRRYAYDTNADIDHASLNSFNTPGGKVAVNGNPNNVLAELPFFTPQAGDYVVLDLYKGMVEMASGISDFYSKGMGSPVGNRTATGINQVIGESSYRHKMFIRNVEIDVLQPLLEMCAAMVQQFCNDTIEVAITDANPVIPKWRMIQPEELIGSFSFNLVAANYASNKVIRQRNLLAFAQVVGGSPFWNEFEAIKELAKVFEIRNVTRLLKSPQQVAQEQQAALQQQIQMMIFETMLQTESKARLAQSKPKPVGQGKGGGRPAKAQFEGKIPGAGLTSSIREFAQNMGANALGLEGLGEVPGAE
jgi:hypothetical protein